MFDIGFFELVLVAVVGLVVIGPERLPDTVRTVALWIGRLKRSLRETRQELEQQIGADDIRRQLHNEDVMRSLQATKDEFERTLHNPLGDLEHDADKEGEPGIHTPSNFASNAADEPATVEPATVEPATPIEPKLTAGKTES